MTRSPQRIPGLARRLRVQRLIPHDAIALLELQAVQQKIKAARRCDGPDSQAAMALAHHTTRPLIDGVGHNDAFAGA